VTSGPNLQKLLSDPTLDADEQKRVMQMTDGFLKSKLDPTKQWESISPGDLNKNRIRWDSESKAIRTRNENGDWAAPAEDPLRRRWAKAMADDNRELLSTTVPELHDPSLGDPMGDLQRKIVLKNFVSPEVKRSMKSALPYTPAAGAAAAGYALTPGDWHHRALGAMGAGLAGSRLGQSEAALMLSNPQVAALISALTRGGAALTDATQVRPQPGQ
jgi:hypothetical protein